MTSTVNRADGIRASYSAHPIDSIEPLSDEPNGYRAISLDFLKLMFAVDEFITAAEDARLQDLP
jgi:hypothetical protein